MSNYEEGEPSELREEEKPPKKLKIKLEVNPNTAINKGKEAAVEDGDQVKLFSCPICSKTFRSDKAVHGHMNTHPERPWRGIRQKNYSRPITANSHDDHHKAGSDPMGVLSGGWPAGVRRGRTAGSATAMAAARSSSVIVDDEEELVMGAAYGIVLLATGDERYRILPPSNKNGIRKNLEEGGNKLETYRKSFGDDLHKNLPPLQIDGNRVSAISPPSNKKPRISGYEDEGKNQKLDENKLKMVSYTEGISSCGNGNTTSLVGAKKRKRMNNEATELLMMIKSYTCGTCGKSFATPQALGGHTSSSGHSNKTAIKSAGPEQAPSQHFECVKEEQSTLSSSSGSHVCKCCKKAFPSGQALGGHQRVHSNKPSSGSVVVANDNNNNNGVVNEGDDQDEVIIRKPALCLDLNEIPADDSEEEDQ